MQVLILNNNFQGMVKQWQDLFYGGRHAATEMVNPDWVLFAKVNRVNLDHRSSLERVHLGRQCT